jgi:putative nucleotidyltransferase with HDIG domain
MYVGAVAVAALALVWRLYSYNPTVNSGQLQAVFCFALLSIFAQSLRYHLARGATGSIAFIPYLAVAALVPTWVAVVAVGVSVLVVELGGRRPALKVLFNVAQHVLAVGLAIGAYVNLGGVPLLESTELRVVPYVALFTVFTSVNTLAVSSVVAMSEGKAINEVWKENTSSTVLYDLLALPFVYVFARVYVNFGWIGIAALGTFVLGVRQLYTVNWQLQKTNQELLELMVAAIEARDPYTSGHSRRVARFSTIIAQAMGLSTREVERVRVAALLHDVGKIHEVFAPILSKAAKLTAEERAIIETHPIKSAELVQTVSQLRDVVLPVRHHHENWDGSGYPDGLKGDSIPLASRIIMFADTIDAMTTNRPYRAALGEQEVTSELLKWRSRQFDPLICDTLLASPLYRQCFRDPAEDTEAVPSIRLFAPRRPRVAAAS